MRFLRASYVAFTQVTLSPEDDPDAVHVAAFLLFDLPYLSRYPPYTYHYAPPFHFHFE